MALILCTCGITDDVDVFDNVRGGREVVKIAQLEFDANTKALDSNLPTHASARRSNRKTPSPIKAIPNRMV